MSETLSPAGTVVAEAALAVPSKLAAKPPKVTVAVALPITSVPVDLLV